MFGEGPNSEGGGHRVNKVFGRRLSKFCIGIRLAEYCQDKVLGEVGSSQRVVAGGEMYGAQVSQMRVAVGRAYSMERSWTAFL